MRVLLSVLKKHGTQLPADIKPIDLGICRELIEAGKGKIKKNDICLLNWKNAIKTD